MHQLVYISTARARPSNAELDDILTVSRRNNAANGVSGLLVSGGIRFLQALEGPTPAVFATYERICTDPRHFAFVLLKSGSISERAFGNWSMAHEMAGTVRQTSIVEAVSDLTKNLADAGLKAEFQAFAEIHARAA